MLETTEKSQLNGIMKMRIYNDAIIPKMTWEFSIFHFPITFFENLESTYVQQMLAELSSDLSLN